jgi:hypothetical protein
MIARKFTRLTVIDGPIQVPRDTLWVCKCDCGAVRTVSQSKLRSGHVKSCGCLQKDKARARLLTHGKYHEAEYRVWVNMKKRCADPRYAKWYGNIIVCAEWIDSYDNFIACVGRKPYPNATLDRIDPKGNYEPENVRWASRNIQSRNTKNHVTNKTGIRGVSWSKEKNKWRAAIYVNGRQKHVGYFDDIREAETARKEAEHKFWLHDKRTLAEIALEELK